MLPQIPRLNYTVEPHRMRSHPPKKHDRRKAISSILAYVNVEIRRQISLKIMQKITFLVPVC